MIKNDKEFGNEWYRKGKTYRAKTLDALKMLYSAGIAATLMDQPITSWETENEDKTKKE